jgi:hypothetical protein
MFNTSIEVEAGDASRYGSDKIARHPCLTPVSESEPDTFSLWLRQNCASSMCNTSIVAGARDDWRYGSQKIATHAALTATLGV